MKGHRVAFLIGIITAANFARSQAISSPQYLYQLQNANFAKLQSSNYKYYVVDPDDTQLTKEQVAALIKQGKTILAYLSIGEAETYRDYWQKTWKTDNPSFLEKDNPEWSGNYKVRFWMPEWQTILLNFMRNHILLKGFSGVYLDIVDAYEYFQPQRATAENEMVQFIARIRSEARAIVPGALIFPQNCVELYARSGYKGLIDGFGVEDTWTDGDKKVDNDNLNEVLGFLRQAKRDGKVVLAVDYPKKQNNICSFYRNCAAEGFTCGAFDRELKGIARNCTT